MITPAIQYLKDCLGEPFFLTYFLATILGGVSIAPINTFRVFHARSVGMSDQFYGHSLALSYTISAALAFPLGMLADRFHPLRLAICALSLYALSTMYGFLFGTQVWAFSVAFVLHTVVSGVYLTAVAALGQRLLPRSKFAEIASAGGIISSIVYMILPMALNWCNAPQLSGRLSAQQHNRRVQRGTLYSTVHNILLFIKFKARGGDDAYVAPGDTEPERSVIALHLAASKRKP